MSEPPEVWAFALANLGLFVVSSVLTGLSCVAYRRSDGRRSYLLSTVGFVCVVLGGLVEPVYQFVVRGDSNLNATELLWLQAGEGILIAVGLALLFYAITHHESEPSPTRETAFEFDPHELDD